MFVDACAIIAVLSDEPEAGRVSRALEHASTRITSPVAVLESVLGLARPDKFNMGKPAAQTIVMEFLDARGIEVRDLPPPAETVALSVHAADRYGSGPRRLNLGDCLHYACAKHYGVPILATADEFRQTDIETVP